MGGWVYAHSENDSVGTYSKTGSGRTGVGTYAYSAALHEDWTFAYGTSGNGSVA